MKENPKKTIKVNGKAVEINDQEFKLVTNPDASFEDYGWNLDYVEDMLYVAEFEPEHEWMSDPDVLNDIAIVYDEGIGVETDMEKAIKYFKMAIALNNDLARSNLADIYRKGKNGVPVDHKQAFELYLDCKLPYAFYRVGEYYENGRAGVQNIQKAKQNYRVAYRAGHGLARKKLQTFNFLED